MILLASITTISMLIVATPTASPQEAGDETAADAGTPQRVIVHADRHRRVPGYVVEDTSMLITMRDLEGTVLSFTKPRRVVYLVDPQPGQTGTVYMSDGQRHHGVILEDSFEKVVVEIEGINATFKREFVDEVMLDPTFEEQYEHFRKMLKPGMNVEHYRLCQWLIDQKRWVLAREELDALRTYDDSEPVRRLSRIVDAQLVLLRDRATSAGEDEDDASDAEDDWHTGKLITERDVNIIRVYEIDFDDPPRLTVRPNTINRLIERYGDDSRMPGTAAGRSELFRREAIDIVRLMFDLRARDLYEEIDVLSEPRAMNMFRQRVHNAWLMNNCTTSRCHGGPDAGYFRLHRKRYTDERVRYTNFLLLERYDIVPDWPLINYDRPADSLIIQYGLPRHLARKPHPDVAGWRPAFAGGQNRMREATIEWIESMLFPRPNYPVDLVPPPRPTPSEPSGGSGETTADDPRRDR